MRQRGLFEEIDRLRELTKLGDPLIILNEKINWESFRKILNKIRPEENPDNINNAGRKPFDVVMMFKVILLQRYYGISDDQMEFQLKDRRSFERFVSGGDTLYHRPDAKTIWLYRERFKDVGIAKKSGAPAYDPKLLLKIVLLAYSRGIISSRTIMQACRGNIVFRAFLWPLRSLRSLGLRHT